MKKESEESRKALEDERQEAVKKLTLEHEIEMDALKYHYKSKETESTDQISALTKVRSFLPPQGLVLFECCEKIVENLFFRLFRTQGLCFFLQPAVAPN